MVKKILVLLTIVVFSMGVVSCRTVKIIVKPGKKHKVKKKRKIRRIETLYIKNTVETQLEKVFIV